MAVERIDHKAEARELMLSQFSDYKDLNALMDSWVTPIQSLEDALIDYMANNGISNAAGGILDILGEILGVERDGRFDAEYRTAILSGALLESADGTTEVFLEGFRTLCQSDFCTFREHFPATVYAHAGAGYNNSVLDELRRISPAGVHTRLIVDNEFDSFTMTEILETNNSLVTGDLDEYEVNSNGQTELLCISQSSGETLLDDGDAFAELFDEEWTPLAELVVRGELEIENLIDDAGNNLVDDCGNNLVVAELVPSEVII